MTKTCLYYHHHYR